jgi:DNA-binding transcriptional LysR family regulator
MDGRLIRFTKVAHITYHHWRLNKGDLLVDIRHLRSFVALAEEGKFTSAARRLNQVQSGLSVAIKEMEEELGARLVNRTTRSVALTYAGKLFLEYARSSLAALNDGIQAVRSQDGMVRGRLHLGILQSLGPYINLPAVLQIFRQKYPQVEFAVRSLDSGEIPALVRNGNVDLSFVPLVRQETWPGVTTIPFAQDPVVAICSMKHTLARQRNVTLEIISKETFVDLTAERALRFLVDQLFLIRSLRRNSVYQVSSVETMMEFVAGGLGVSLVPSALARLSSHSKQIHTLLIRKQDQELPKWRIGIATRTERPTAYGKTTVDLFLDTLSTFHTSDHDDSPAIGLGAMG